MKPFRLVDGQEARDYQLRAANKVFNGTPTHNGDKDGTATIIDMGLGKTFITLHAIAELFAWKVITKPVLLVAPILVCETVWRQEAAIWNTTNWLTFSLLRGAKSARQYALSRPAHIYLVNPELLGWLYTELRGDWSLFDMLCVDESSMFKSDRSKRFKVLSNVGKEEIVKDPVSGAKLRDETGKLLHSKPYKFKRSVILTGTPAPTSLMNIWPQIFLLDQGKRLHSRFQTYRDRYFFKTGEVAEHVFKYDISDEEFEVRPEWMPKDGAPIKIHELIADIAVELNGADYGILPATLGDASKGDVPPTHLHKVELSPDIRNLYNQMEREALIELGKDFVMAANGGARTLLCQQIANGFVYRTDEFGTQKTEPLHTLKLDKLEELLDTLNANTIITYHFKADRERLAARLSQSKRAFAILTAKNAASVIDRWNKGILPILLLHPQSAGHGINLQMGGHQIIWYSQIWSLERYLQTNARIARSGQKSIVGIHHIVADKTVDELMLLMYRERGDNQNKFRQALRKYQELRGWSIETARLADVL